MKRRFEHLENARPDRAPEAPRPMRTRFEPDASPGADPSTPGQRSTRVPAAAPVMVPDDELRNRLPPEAFAAPTTPTTARFAPDAPSIALAERETSTLPFRRCAECQVDSHRMATTCQHCGASLETAAQRAYMEQVAQALAQAKAAETAQSAAFEAAQTEALAAQHTATRAWGEALAAQSRRTTEARLRHDEGRAGIGPDAEQILLDLLPSHLRKPVAFGIAAVAVAFIGFGLLLDHPMLLRIGGAALAAVLIALIPRGTWRSW